MTSPVVMTFPHQQRRYDSHGTGLLPFDPSPFARKAKTTSAILTQLLAYNLCSITDNACDYLIGCGALTGPYRNQK